MQPASWSSTVARSTWLSILKMRKLATRENPDPSRRNPAVGAGRLSGCVTAEPVTEDLAFLEIDDGLGDLGGVVGDALEVPCRVDEPQPRVDTLGMSDDLPLEQLEHVSIMAVDTFFGGNHGLCLNGICLNQGVEAAVHLVQSFHSQIFQWLRDWEGEGIDGQLPDP